MARVSSFTIFMLVTIVCYTLFSTAFFAVIEGSDVEDPYGGRVSSWEYTAAYPYSQAQNFSLVAGNQVFYEDLEPTRQVKINFATDPITALLIGDGIRFKRAGVDWWNSWYYYEMTGSPVNKDRLLGQWDPYTNYAKFIFDQGGQFETHAFIYPAWLTDETGNRTGYAYPTITASITAGVLTIVLATNASYPTFDIGLIFGVLTGFSAYGAPAPVAIIIGGIWWILVILVIVKLVVG